MAMAIDDVAATDEFLVSDRHEYLRRRASKLTPPNTIIPALAGSGTEDRGSV